MTAAEAPSCCYTLGCVRNSDTWWDKNRRRDLMITQAHPTQINTYHQAQVISGHWWQGRIIFMISSFLFLCHWWLFSFPNNSLSPQTPTCLLLQFMNGRTSAKNVNERCTICFKSAFKTSVLIPKETWRGGRQPGCCWCCQLYPFQCMTSW